MCAKTDDGSPAPKTHWELKYRDATKPRLYGDPKTYEMGARWLEGLFVEDWGCGLGGLRRFVPEDRYRGIDGTWSRFADEVVDLEQYRSEVPGIFMRGVLEHNWGWQRVLDNALASFTRRMALVLFTPWAEGETYPMKVYPGFDVPDLSFRRQDIVERFGEIEWTSEENIPTDTQYGLEHVFMLERPSQ